MAMSSAERQRKYRAKKENECQQIPKIPCACGCGQMIPQINKLGKSAKYAHGHNAKANDNTAKTRFNPGQKPWNKGKSHPAASKTHKGKKVPKEIIEKSVKARREKSGYSAWNKGIPMKEESKRKLSKSLKGLFSGEKNPAWEGGKSFEPYSPDFNDKLKTKVWERAKGNCEICNVRLGKYGEKPNVHHKDEDKLNSDIDNLQLLCVRCHAKIHWNKRKMERKVV
jgi:hypothetical protein